MPTVSNGEGAMRTSCTSDKGIGATVERIVAVIDRQEGARENIESAGFAFESLFTKADLGITA